MYIIAVINQKGGVGKTTTVVTLAQLFAAERYSILCIDLDPQGNVAESLGLDSWPGLYQFVVQDKMGAAIRPVRLHLDLIASDHRTVEVRNYLQSRAFGELTLKQRLDGMDYDVCILDLAPSIDILQIVALAACTHYLIPVQLDALAVSGAARVVNSARTMSDLGRLDARFLGVLPTFWERSTNESGEQLARLDRIFQDLVWPPIPRDTKIREASAFGQTIVEYEPASRAMRGIELDGHYVGGYDAVFERLCKELAHGS